MKRIIIANAFSLNMLDANNGECDALMRPLKSIEASALVNLYSGMNFPVLSCVGHEDVARMMASELGYDIPCSRVSASVLPGDCVIVGQYSGPRLPEGATELPPAARIQWWSVRIGRVE